MYLLFSLLEPFCYLPAEEHSKVIDASELWNGHENTEEANTNIKTSHLRANVMGIAKGSINTDKTFKTLVTLNPTIWTERKFPDNQR